MKGNFDAIIRDSRPVIVDFHALWCAPCKAQTPILKEIVGELGERIRIIKIDVDKNPAIAARYNIQAVPTLAIFQNGELKYLQPGLHSKQQLMNVLNKML